MSANASEFDDVVEVSKRHQILPPELLMADALGGAAEYERQKGLPQPPLGLPNGGLVGQSFSFNEIICQNHSDHGRVFGRQKRPK